jgi:hypothetical protein
VHLEEHADELSSISKLMDEIARLRESKDDQDTLEPRIHDLSDQLSMHLFNQRQHDREVLEVLKRIETLGGHGAAGTHARTHAALRRRHSPPTACHSTSLPAQHLTDQTTGHLTTNNNHLSDQTTHQTHNLPIACRCPHHQPIHHSATTTAQPTKFLTATHIANEYISALAKSHSSVDAPPLTPPTTPLFVQPQGSVDAAVSDTDETLANLLTQLDFMILDDARRAALTTAVYKDKGEESAQAMVARAAVEDSKR